MSKVASSFKTHTWLWFLQRVTAAFLIATIAFHFLWLHFVNHAGDITMQGTVGRMGEIGYLIAMLLFLFTAAFHGLNGVYNALLNQGLSGTHRQVVKWLLVGAGFLVSIQGIRVAVAIAGVTL
jgi:succinate dehydrogenase / fumarate reductase membrane anchor subunit